MFPSLTPASFPAAPGALGPSPFSPYGTPERFPGFETLQPPWGQ
jgi:hypothetical protein